MKPPINVRMTFLKKEQVAEDVWTFYFNRKNTNSTFLPGQHQNLILPFIEDPKENNRLFSISSSPLEKNVVAVTIKEGRSIFKKALFSMLPQTVIEMVLPLGAFTFDMTKQTSSVLLAGGVGITPFMSMLTTLQYEALHNDIILFASFATPEKMLFQNEIKEIKKKNPKIKSIYTLTQKYPSHWDGEKERISEAMLLRYLPDLLSNTYYICGSTQFIGGIADMLLDRGVTNKQGKIELFIGL